MEQPVNVFWFRRDLRLHDNTALHLALAAGLPVLPVFIFDTDILDQLEDRHDSRVAFIHRCIDDINSKFHRAGSSLRVYHTKPIEAFERLLSKFRVDTVFANDDYEPYARARDEQINDFLKGRGARFQRSKDHVIFEKNDIVKNDGSPYLVFTPYSRVWKQKFNSVASNVSGNAELGNLLKCDAFPVPTLASIGFSEGRFNVPPANLSAEVLATYESRRDYPGIEGTSRMGPHLRFGTVSTRELAALASGTSEIFLNELIWREFYQMIMWHFPHLGRGASFKKEFDDIEWRNNEDEFRRWCDGTTGYPMVDAAMRELNSTGFMHNRMRMLTASFLSKHLLTDWRWGEAYFAQKLLDYELASNNGGWQWAAGSGCDAAPYFRIFNPILQQKKFDPQHKYINKWIPDMTIGVYPSPIVEHEFARKRCLEVYGKAVSARKV